ncbi:MAG: hypothetical protein AAF571_12500 [Verrucomicrobiota bacterium]
MDIKISHIIKMVEICDAIKSSYLHIAQPITAKSMLRAKELASSEMEVELLAVWHQEETVELPAGFTFAGHLDRWCWNYFPELKDEKRKDLPLLGDILEKLYETSDAEWVMYTNLDIGLYPHFYLRVKEFIEAGYDAICINRVELPESYGGTLIDEDNYTDYLFAKPDRHPGIDCFVFQRSIIPKLDLRGCFIGFPPIGQVLKTQIEKHSRKPLWVKDEILTFHIGKTSYWKATGKSAYEIANETECFNIYRNQFGLGGYLRRFSFLLEILKRRWLKSS